MITIQSANILNNAPGIRKNTRKTGHKETLMKVILFDNVIIDFYFIQTIKLIEFIYPSSVAE